MQKRLMKFGLSSIILFLHKAKPANRNTYYTVVVFPVVQSDRGGQITYHGPGQQIMYVLIDIKRHEHLNVRQLVNRT